jgi:alpha-amylase
MSKRPALKKRFFKNPVVLFLGRLTYQKGPVYFLEIAKRVIDICPEVQFIMAGSGDLEKELMHRSARYKLKTRFLFTGFLTRKEVEKILAASDIILLPSLSEPFGIAALEAMSCGVVAIISEFSGVSEIVLSVFDVGSIVTPFDKEMNRSIIRKVAKKCYIPVNKLLLDLIKKYDGHFKVAFSVTGMAVEQLKHDSPNAMDLFLELGESGCVEFIGETYYHSLAALYDREEFVEQVQMHLTLMQEEFDAIPTVFRNTELIYENFISDVLLKFSNFKIILTEGADRILGARSPLRLYRTYNGQHLLLLKHYSLSDDIAFRFSDKGWCRYPLTADKFLTQVESILLQENKDKNMYLNLFIDYETFGEHQPKESGIFDFIVDLAEKVIVHESMSFVFPSEVSEERGSTAERLSIYPSISWADVSRDLSAWSSNDMQKNAVDVLFEILHYIKQKGDEELLETIRKMTSSDHLYYMSTKYFQDGDIHKYFSPYDSPENAYRYFLFASADIYEKLNIA